MLTQGLDSDRTKDLMRKVALRIDKIAREHRLPGAAIANRPSGECANCDGCEKRKQAGLRLPCWPSRSIYMLRLGTTVMSAETMVRNLLDGLRPSGGVRHVALVTGLKHHLGPRRSLS